MVSVAPTSHGGACLSRTVRPPNSSSRVRPVVRYTCCTGFCVVKPRTFAVAAGVGAMRSPVVAASERTTASVDGALGPKRPKTGRT